MEKSEQIWKNVRHFPFNLVCTTKSLWRKDKANVIFLSLRLYSFLLSHNFFLRFPFPLQPDPLSLRGVHEIVRYHWIIVGQFSFDWHRARSPEFVFSVYTAVVFSWVFNWFSAVVFSWVFNWFSAVVFIWVFIWFSAVVCRCFDQIHEPNLG